MAVIVDTYTAADNFFTEYRYNGTTTYREVYTGGVQLKVGYEEDDDYERQYNTFIRFDGIINRGVKLSSVKLKLAQISAGKACTIRIKYLSSNVSNNMSYSAAEGVSGTDLNSYAYISQSNHTISLNSGYFSNPGNSINLKLYTTDNLDGYDIFFAPRPTLELTWDTGPDAPTVIYPDGAFLQKNQPIKFEWTYSNSGGSPQAAAYIQWRKKGTSAWHTVTASGANNYYTFPADTFNTGYIDWQVRVADTNGLCSVYSNLASFYAIGQPDKPSMGVTYSGTTLSVTWSAELQDSWQLQVLDASGNIVHDTGTDNSGSALSYKKTLYLADGDYTVKLRTKNTYDYWSDWATKSFTVTRTAVDVPALQIVSNCASGIRLKASYTTPTCEIYKRKINDTDYVKIATLSNTAEITDYVVASGVKYEYFARAVKDDGSFSDSAAVVGMATLNATYIADVKNLDNQICFDRSLDQNNRTIYYTKNKSLSYFAGREYPVVEINGTKECSLSLSYFIDTDMFDSFIGLVDAPCVLYRDSRGRMFYGTITNLTIDEHFTVDGYAISFTLARVDYEG
jgi:hypothetical protein